MSLSNKISEIEKECKALEARVLLLEIALERIHKGEKLPHKIADQALWGSRTTEAPTVELEEELAHLRGQGPDPFKNLPREGQTKDPAVSGDMSPWVIAMKRATEETVTESDHVSESFRTGWIDRTLSKAHTTPRFSRDNKGEVYMTYTLPVRDPGHAWSAQDRNDYVRGWEEAEKEIAVMMPEARPAKAQAEHSDEWHLDRGRAIDAWNEGHAGVHALIDEVRKESGRAEPVSSNEDLRAEIEHWRSLYANLLREHDAWASVANGALDEVKRLRDIPYSIPETAVPNDVEINRLVQACRPSGDAVKDGSLGTIVPMGFEAVQSLVTRFARQSAVTTTQPVESRPEPSVKSMPSSAVVSLHSDIATTPESYKRVEEGVRAAMADKPVQRHPGHPAASLAPIEKDDAKWAAEVVAELLSNDPAWGEDQFFTREGWMAAVLKNCREDERTRFSAEMARLPEVAIKALEDLVQELRDDSLEEDDPDEPIGLSPEKDAYAIEAWLQSTNQGLTSVSKVVETLTSRLDHVYYWYSTRLERLRAFAEERGWLKEYATITANGTLDKHEPPTYAQQYNMLKHRAELAEERLAAFESGTEVHQPTLKRCIEECNSIAKGCEDRVRTSSGNTAWSELDRASGAHRCATALEARLTK